MPALLKGFIDKVFKNSVKNWCRQNREELKLKKRKILMKSSKLA